MLARSGFWGKLFVLIFLKYLYRRPEDLELVLEESPVVFICTRFMVGLVSFLGKGSLRKDATTADKARFGPSLCPWFQAWFGGGPSPKKNSSLGPT